jgi:acetoin utilization deacetylase AcuC-like enzyme
VRAFYSDHFVLPLPEGHKFPMAKYSRLREDRGEGFCVFDKNFPFRKETSDLDVALPDGTGDDQYLALLRQHLDDVLNRHQPDFVFYLAGADPFEGDRLGRLKMTIDGLRARDELVLGACSRAGLPVAISMSGGYATDVDAIVTIHANTIHTASRQKWLNTFVS